MIALTSENRCLPRAFATRKRTRIIDERVEGWTHDQHLHDFKANDRFRFRKPRAVDKHDGVCAALLAVLRCTIRMGSMRRAGGQLAHLIGQDDGQAVENLLLECAWLDGGERDVRSNGTKDDSHDSRPDRALHQHTRARQSLT